MTEFGTGDADGELAGRQPSPDESPEPTEQLRAEIRRLRRENAELRRRLEAGGEDGSDIDATEPRRPGRAVSPTLFPAAPPLPDVDATSPPEDKIRLFRALFRGRDDVYAVRWTDDRSGKSGYSPARRRPRGSGSEHRRGPCLPLTDEVVRDHLLGRLVVGVYPLLGDDTCWFLACDFDGDGWHLDALEYVDVCLEEGVPAYLERSRSGGGGHVWIFFSAPVVAAEARRLGAGLLKTTMARRAELDLASYDRFFPNQDFLPRGGFGNLIALPLQKRARGAGNSEFVDKVQRPHPDQWAFLSGVERLSPGEVASLLDRLPPLEVGPGSLASVIAPGASRASWPGDRGSAEWRDSYPDSIRCVLANRLSVEKHGLPPPLLALLKHLASVHNPDFYQRQKMRLSTYGVPRLIRCYDEDLTHLHLPRGVVEEFGDLMEEVGVEVELEDRQIPARGNSLPELSFQGRLEEWQRGAVDDLLDDDIGVLVAPPGAGKTVMGCAVIAARSVRTLILTHRRAILEQWRDHLARFLGVPEEDIGQLGAGRNSLSRQLDVAMLQTLARREEEIAAILDAYGLVVVDECHHIPAVSFERVVRESPARYVLGLTATPWRRDGLEDLITMQCGPVRHEVRRDSTGAAGLRRVLIPRETSFRLPDLASTDGGAAGTAAVPVHGDDKGSLSIQDVFRILVEDRGRTAMIAEDVSAALDAGRRCLILSQWREHCRALAEALAEGGTEVSLLHGARTRPELDAAVTEIRQLPPERDLAVVATGQLLGEGFDCPQIDTLFLAFPIAFKGSVVQYVGRLLREAQGKDEVRVYDYVDTRVPVLRRMHEKRKKAYRALGFTV